MANQKISDFKSGFLGGTRANRFNVEIVWPTGVVAEPATSIYHATASKLPEAELGSISIPYRGRVAHYAGDRDYKPWTVTIIDDTGTNASWLAFHQWANLLSSHVNNTVADTTYGIGGSSNLCDVTFNQLNDPSSGGTDTFTGHTTMRTIILKHAWPSEVGQIGLDMGEGGSLVSFSVTFTYDYYEITKGLTTTTTP
jgi:hypothetical protein